MSKKKEEQNVNQKLNLLKKQQQNWNEERSHALSEEKKEKNTPSKRKGVDKKPDTLLWASSGSNNEYSGFVVRKGVCTPDMKANKNRPESARSNATNKSTSSTGKSKTDSGTKTKVASESKKKTNKDFKSETPKALCMNDSGLPEVDSCSIRSEDTADLIFKDIENDLASLNCYSVDSYMDTKKYNDVMSNHLCPICDELMIDCHTPKILIPCGHSFCSICICEENYCPTCRNKIVAIEENDTMSKIIIRFQLKREEDERKRKEAEGQKYIDEYHLLDTRTNAMKEEAADIIDKMERTTLELVERKRSIKAIVDRGGDIQKQIEELQQTLKSLEIRCNEENNAIQTLESDYDGYKKQLIMTEKTVKTLKQSKERVKIIVGNLLPSLDLDD